MSKNIIVAIDEIDMYVAKNILNNLDSDKCLIKIGSVAFSSIGRELVLFAESKGFDIFLDLKFHDIPNTVYKSIKGLSNLPIKMLTIHTSGGIEMMRAAMKAVKDNNIKIFGVTTLTSLDDKDTTDIYKRTNINQVNKMLDLSVEAGIHGVVCSPHELRLVAERKSLQSITPGIRLKYSDDDQRRVMTPKKAIDLGSDFIVIGRPITSSNDIKKSLNEIYNSIK